MLNNDRNNNVVKFQGKEKIEPMQGEIWMCQLESSNYKNLQKGKRPVVICQNPLASKYSPLASIVPFTGQQAKKNLPTHVKVEANEQTKLRNDSIALAEQSRCVSKDQLLYKMGSVDKGTLEKINKAIEIQWNSRSLDMELIEDSLIMIDKITKVLKREKDEFKKILLRDASKKFRNVVEKEYKAVYNDNYEYWMYKKIAEVQKKERNKVFNLVNTNREEMTCDAL